MFDGLKQFTQSKSDKYLAFVPWAPARLWIMIILYVVVTYLLLFVFIPLLFHVAGFIFHLIGFLIVFAFILGAGYLIYKAVKH
jgi:hypothetical protein